MNVRQDFLLRASKKTFYGVAVALAATIVLGVFLLSGLSGSSTVSAQRGDQSRGSAKAPRADMLAVALDFGSAADYSVFADKGIAEGNSRINGKTGVASADESGKRAKTDLSKAFSAIEQLPCTERTADFRRGKFAPGVYCASKGDLSGDFILDGQGSDSSIFVFRMDEKLRAGSDLNIQLTNGASASNVFFVSGEGASIGEGVRFGGSVIARNSVTVGSGSTVEGKVLSVDGKVAMSEAAAGPGTGFLEICKNFTALRTTPGLSDRIFRFQIGSQIIQVPFGSCSGPIQLPAGVTTITELLDGPLIPNGTFSGRFRLVDVRTNVDGALTSVNLPTRTVMVNVRAGTIQNQTVVDFINVFAVMAVVEICKYPVANTTAAGGAVTTPANSDIIGSQDVTGFFDFTIDVLGNQVFTVPVNACSRPIQVNVPTGSIGPPPQPAVVNITELAEEGFQLEAGSTFPADRFLNLFFNVGLFDGPDPDDIQGSSPGESFFNPGGGVIQAQVLEGGTANQTTVNFFNRAIPGLVKICKITADPTTIPVGTRFRFFVIGREPSNPFPGPVLPGTDTRRTVIVPAGPADQGGFCRFVTVNEDGTGGFVRYIVGSQVLVEEEGVATNDPRALPLDPLVAIPAGSPGGRACTSATAPTNPCPQPQTTPPTGVRVSRIRLDEGNSMFQSPATINNVLLPGGTLTLNPNPNLATRQAIFRARRDFVEVDFTDFLYRPAILKVCKVPGAGVTVGQRFDFTIAVNNPGGLFATALAPQNITASVTVGPSGTNPNVPDTTCVFVSGPFTATSTTPAIGTFNFGSTLTITETAVTGLQVTDIRAPRLDGAGANGTVSNVDLPNRRANFTLNATTVAGGIAVNEIEFVNGTAIPPAPVQRAAFDFDGDNRSDMGAFRPSNGIWHLLQSRDGYMALQFGNSEDKLMAADYDGDGKADIAVFRPSNGVWYIMRSRDGFMGAQFGQRGDVPVAADFDGDGRADLAVFRPSNGVWYLMNSREGFSAVSFGANGDKPVAADYDGDGRADIAVYRGGVWHLLQSRDGYTGVQFGVASDKPVAADYDGDGRADIAVYRSGVWHILRSKEGYVGVGFGVETDVPVPADYNGDGRTDIAVYRDGTWHILDSGQTESGYRAVQFGQATDMPVSSR